MHSCLCAHCSRRTSGRGVAIIPFPGRLPFWASPFPSRLANASGRIEFIIFLIMDWSFASGCSPPRLSATQFPSATDSQCSVRWGLPPHGWCALSGALGRASRPFRLETTLPNVQTPGALLATSGSCKQLPSRSRRPLPHSSSRRPVLTPLCGILLAKTLSLAIFEICLRSRLGETSLA
jgi:hypothetical protein